MWGACPISELFHQWADLSANCPVSELSCLRAVLSVNWPLEKCLSASHLLVNCPCTVFILVEVKYILSPSIGFSKNISERTVGCAICRCLSLVNLQGMILKVDYIWITQWQQSYCFNGFKRRTLIPASLVTSSHEGLEVHTLAQKRQQIEIFGKPSLNFIQQAIQLKPQNFTKNYCHVCLNNIHK